MRPRRSSPAWASRPARPSPWPPPTTASTRWPARWWALSLHGVGAAPQRRARRHGACALPAHRFPDQGGQDMKQFKGRTAVITGAASGFGLEASRIAAREGMNVVMADVQPDALDRAAAEIGAMGAAVLAFGWTCRRPPRWRRIGRGDSGALRRAELRLQQRRRRRRRADLGEHAAGLGMGARRQPDGRGARRARVHADDAGGRAPGPGLRRPHRQHRVDGRSAEPAEHGRLQRQQACGGVTQRDAVPGPARW